MWGERHTDICIDMTELTGTPCNYADVPTDNNMSHCHKQH